MTTPAQLLQHALRADPTRPLVTFYDDATGERSELSVATFDNWVAKTANLLQDGLALEPGARVQLRLPVHWQTLVWLMACWSAGVVAVPGPLDETAESTAGSTAEAAVSAEPEVVVTTLEAARRGEPTRAPETVVLALRPLGMPGEGVPGGMLDYDVEIRPYADRFAPFERVPPSAPAFEIDGSCATAAALAADAAQRAAAWQLRSADRLLVSAPLLSRGGVLAGLLAPLAAGASVVLCRRLSPARLARRIESERVTAVVRPVTVRHDTGAAGGPAEEELHAALSALHPAGVGSADLRLL